MTTTDRHDAPTVSCEGWWEQEYFGRQPMDGLRLTISDRQLNGQGHDIIGAFSLTGVISPGGAVAIRKRYLGAHDVDYLGTYDGEGVFHGEWRIHDLRGPWLIRVRRVESADSQEIREFLPVKPRGSAADKNT